MLVEIIKENCTNMDLLIHLKAFNKTLSGAIFRETQIELSNDQESTEWVQAQDVYEKGLVRNQVESGSIFLKIGYDKERALKLLHVYSQEIQYLN
jgi:hypothetical protein